MASLRVQLKDMSTMCDICCALVKNDTIVKVQRCPLWPSVMAQRCAHAESYIPQRRKLNHAAKTYDDPKFSFVNALSTLSRVLESILYFNKQHTSWNSSVEEIPCCDSGEYSSTSCSVAVCFHPQCVHFAQEILQDDENQKQIASKDPKLEPRLLKWACYTIQAKA